MPARAKPKPNRPHAFVLEMLAPLHPDVRPLFSGFAVYVGDNLVCILRERPKSPQDNGVWLVLSEAADPADPQFRIDFPSLRRIELLGDKMSHWLLIPSDGPDFEQEALHLCDRLLHHDPRIGRVPASRR